MVVIVFNSDRRCSHHVAGRRTPSCIPHPMRGKIKPPSNENNVRRQKGCDTLIGHFAKSVTFTCDTIE